MTLNSLRNIDFTDEKVLDFSWFAHFQDHMEITQALQKQYGIQLTLYNIFPLSREAFDTIMLAHQQYHDDMNGILGLEGTDLQSLSPEDKRAQAAWVNENFYEHYAARQALGI
jgi:hypothetical protein